MGIFESLGTRVSQFLRPEDADMRLIRAAAEGQDVDKENLGKAYWRKYHGTYVPPAQWHSMARNRRDAVYRQRMKLKSLFSRFSREQQNWARDMRPPRHNDWPPKRDFSESS